MTTLLLSVGDASGDAHAAELVEALRPRLPGARFLGMGGSQMEKAGVELVVAQRELAVGGLVELLPSLPRIWRAWRKLCAVLESARPDLAVLVDASGINLPLARRARRAGVPTLYYVAPQVWAWRRRRLRRLAQVDRVAAILPFEPALHAAHGVASEFVGHPLVDRLATAPPRERARAALGIPPEALWVALLPGSRRNELRHNLELFVATARLLHAREPRLGFVLPVPASLDAAGVAARVRALGLPALLRLDVVAGRSVEALAACDAVLAKPGTATLEAALLGCPLVVAARVHPLTAALLRRMVEVDCVAMPNLIAGESIVPELLQSEARPERIADAVQAHLTGPVRARQLERFAALRRSLPGGAPQRTAAIALEMIDARRAA